MKEVEEEDKREPILPFSFCGCFECVCVCVSGGAGIKSNWNEIEMVSQLWTKHRRFAFIWSPLEFHITLKHKLISTYLPTRNDFCAVKAFVVVLHRPFIVSMAHGMESNNFHFNWSRFIWHRRTIYTHYN